MRLKRFSRLDRLGVFSMILSSKSLGFDNMTGLEGSKSVGCYFECCVGWHGHTLVGGFHRNFTRHCHCWNVRAREPSKSSVLWTPNHVHNVYIYIYIWYPPPKKNLHFCIFYWYVQCFWHIWGPFFLGIFWMIFEVVFTNVYKRYGSIAADLDPRSKIQDSRKNFLDPRSGSKIQDPRF